MTTNRFKLDREAILSHERVYLIDDLIPISEHLDSMEKFINSCFEANDVVQSGRVIALRSTDKNRLSSAFKAGLYLGKYDDLGNDNRFLSKMVKAGHSYEPIRGESILFLYIGVGKPSYDHLITYSVGRTTRIAGGQRANKPWGFEVPVEAKNKQLYIDMNIPRIKEVVEYITKTEDNPTPEQLQAMRSSLPVGYVMPPFLLEFSEEALIKSVFTQRLFGNGVQGATVDVVKDMWNCVLQIDKEKWETLADYHGSHINSWLKAMRTLRDKDYSIEEVLEKAGIPFEAGDAVIIPKEIKLYDVLLNTVGKLPPSMWDKQK